MNNSVILDELFPYGKELALEIINDFTVIFGFIIAISVVSLLSSIISKAFSAFFLESKEFKGSRGIVLSPEMSGVKKEYFKILIYLLVIVGFPNGKFLFIPSFLKGISALASGFVACAIFLSYLAAPVKKTRSNF